MILNLSDSTPSEKNTPLLEIQKLLDLYSLSEILLRADVTEEDVLFFLVSEGFLSLPEVKPV